MTEGDKMIERVEMIKGDEFDQLVRLLKDGYEMIGVEFLRTCTKNRRRQMAVSEEMGHENRKNYARAGKSDRILNTNKVYTLQTTVIDKI